MTLRATAKTILLKLDRWSPYPRYYPFIMSDNEKRVFDGAIKESRHYLEFGLGGSTLRAIQKSRAMIYTVESSPEWTNYMRTYAALKYSENRRLRILPVDIGPVRDWGYPESDKFKESFGNYSSSVFQSIDARTIDLALVDGRFRVACVLKTVLECHGNDEIKILIHDFWDRPHYHVVLKYLDVLSRADTLGLFSIKTDVDLEAVAAAYDAYKVTPE